MADTENKNLTRQTGGQVPRPPVIVVMGHIDHGKTKLLDYIRKTNVAEREAGGITQHIGAYEITYKNRKITFLDTPGHEAFSKLRARGAKAADIAILVVAADDGVKPQTIEALEHIKNAELPFIVAINKIDKPEANVERVKKELSENDVLVESWGGKIPSVEISAKAGKNINELLDLIELLADLNEFKADSAKSAEGFVIETHLDSRRGIAASLLILDGTLETGDYILSGSSGGKIKIIEDFLGTPVKKASFSSPVSVIGWDEVPFIGEKFMTDKMPITPVLKAAKKIGEFIEKSLEKNEKENPVYILIKADVASSAEALKESLDKTQFKAEEKSQPIIKIIRAEAGNVSENDFKTALISNAIILAFNVKVDTAISVYREKIDLVSGSIIYEILDSVKKIIEKRLKPKPDREEIGRLEVLAIFRQEKNRQVVGGKVISGEMVRGVRTEIIRNKAVIGQGRIASLESDKKETGKVLAGKEAGIGIDTGEPKIIAGDTLVLFKKTT